jgi:hypothetical protein
MICAVRITVGCFMKRLAAFVLALTSILSFGQIGVIKGHITNRDGKMGFPGLEVTILKGDSLVTGTVTNQNGDFEINQVKSGTYNLKLQFLGFRERIIRDIKIYENRIEVLNLIHPDSCAQSKRFCPKGHSNDLIPIVYGLPGKKHMRQSEKGKVRLGGCLVTECDPKWYCKDHKIEF